MSLYAQAAATVPEPCRVFGTVLRPFCLGHHLLFKRMELPFAGKPTADSTSDELLIGIAICGQRYDESLEQMLNGTWQEIFSRWTEDLYGSGFFTRKLTKVELQDGELLFRAYLEDGYQVPPVWRDDFKGGIEMSAPWESLLKNRLVAAGYSEDEALSGYLPGRWYDYYTMAEIKGAAACRDPKTWKKMFYTKDDYEAMHGKGVE